MNKFLFIVCLTILAFFSICPSYAYAQDSSTCDKLLAKTFGKYDLVNNPLKKGEMFHIEMTTQTENNTTGDETPLTTTLTSTLLFNTSKYILINKDMELYGSCECIIQILKESNRVYIYNAGGDSNNNLQLNQYLSVNKFLLATLKNIQFTQVHDSIQFVLGASQLSYLGEDKVMTNDADNGYILEYKVSSYLGEDKFKSILTKYTYTAIEDENDLLKLDSLRLIYDKKNGINNAYTGYNISDIRSHKNSKP